ncbi:MAG: CPBP family intramembrane metalloprotease [Geothrix sp.]|nr:CPBP family intramembrane metalloprotease [Geothrix sp.]
MPRWFIDERGTLRGGWKALGFLLPLASLGFLASLGLQAAGLRTGAWAGAGVGALASYLCVRLEGRTFGSLGFLPGRRWLLEFLAGTLGGILLILLMALMVKGLGGFHWERTPGVGIPQLLTAAAILLGVAFHEEIIARGYPFQRVVEGAGPWVGQLVFATLFALAHWGNPGMAGATRIWATLNIGLAAILLGFCYLRTRSLALPIGVHLGWNWAQGSLLGFGVSGTTDIKGAWTPVFHGRPEWLTGGAFGLEASLPCAIICGGAIVALWWWKGTAPEPSAGASTASGS